MKKRSGVRCTYHAGRHALAQHASLRDTAGELSSGAKDRLLGRLSAASAVVLATLTGVVCFAGGAAGAPVQKVVVKNTNNSGPGSLREAVMNAVDGETIMIPAGHYRLTSGELSTAVSLQLVGVGARQTLIDGTGTSRVLEDTGTSSTLYLSNLTVENGDSQGGDGGGIEAAGALTLVRVALIANRAGATAAEGEGGGADVAGKLTVRNSLIAHNYAYNGGGADTASTVLIVDSTVAGNQAGSSTAGDNGDSGAIETSDQQASVLDSTIAFNTCFNGATCGGAFYNGDFTFANSIIAENFGFADNGHPAGSAGNPASQTNCDGPNPTRYMTAGDNLGGTIDCGLTDPSDRQKVNPRLGSLKNNGGPTDTLALAGKSPAVDAIPVARCVKVDQRGRRRPDQHEHKCDIGAYERQDS